MLHPRQLQLTMKAVVLNGQLQAKRLEQVRNLIKSNSNLFPDKVEKDMGSFDQLPLVWANNDVVGRVQVLSHGIVSGTVWYLRRGMSSHNF